ncbi:MAG: hypothetical protein NVSMB4_17980 [Acidimicrobiales bacterium]
MTWVTDRPRIAIGRSLSPVLAVAGVVLLALRPLLVAEHHPKVGVVAVLLVVLAVGLLSPISSPFGTRCALPVAVVTLGVGIAAFAVGRVLTAGRAPAPLTFDVVALTSVAAIAEEAFFRRLVFGILRVEGAAAAVAGSAVLFAVVHASEYGWWVVPLDLAAGLILGWQRLATGRWWVPAVTHVIANVLVVI